MSVVGIVAGLVVGILTGLVLVRTRRARMFNGVPITWCGNCGQPTSALCYEHKRQVAQAHHADARD